MERMSYFDIMPGDDGVHLLLEPPSPAYSTLTVRRAFIVWLHSGQQNKFKDVCNYYHRLEALEETFAAEKRATSRLHEFNLLSHSPPTSYFFQRLFPSIYRKDKLEFINVKEADEIKLEDCVFNLEGFQQMKKQGVTATEIIRASQLIRKYCKTHSKSLRNFLVEFQTFAKKCEIVNSVSNVVAYIHKNNVKDEIETWKRLPKHFSFLDTEVIKVVENGISVGRNSSYSADLPKQNNIRILINHSRTKELVNLSYSEVKSPNNKTF